MKKLALDLNTLRVQSFATDEQGVLSFGTVHGEQKGNTGLQDTHCSAIDACASARGCTQINCTVDPAVCPRTYDPVECPSIVDGCPTRINCTPVYPC